MCTNRKRDARLAWSLATYIGILVFPTAMLAKSTPSLSLSNSNLTFGTVMLSSTSAAQVVTLSNSGNAALVISSIGSSGEFNENNTCKVAMKQNSTCTISVSFSPDATGSQSGSVTIYDNAPGSPHQISLTGIGAQPLPQVVISAAALEFGNLTIQTQSQMQALTLSNTGQASLSIGSISVTGDFAQTTTCGSSLTAGSNCSIQVTAKPTSVGARAGTLTIVDNAPGSPHLVALSSNGLTAPEATSSTSISGIWANEGGDKVTRDELRASRHVENSTGTVINRAWDGQTVKLSGARNEVVSFNLVLEAANAAANNVAVRFDTLTGPGGATISSTPTSGDGVFNWVGRNIELFYVRYLQIKGLSYFGYYKGDERQVPVRFQRPWTGNGNGMGGWTDRPDHDKFYPDIMVPLELVPTFSIAQAQNQSIWSDIYVPKNIPGGTYTGKISVIENGVTTHEVPVSLTVQNFNLPDATASKTMVNLDTTDIMWRYAAGTGGYVNWSSIEGRKIAGITDKYFELFHRHKISLVGENECPVADRPCDSGLPRLNGSLFTAQYGYDGPGVNTPEGIYSIGTYGTWGAASYGVPDWKHNQGLFQNHIDNYASWFAQNSPKTEYFLYLEDEPSRANFSQVETWAQWIAQDPGPGKNMLSLSTVDAVTARNFIPTLSIPVTAAGIGACPTSSPCDPAATMASAADFYRNTPGRRFWGYNDGRPGTGTAMTEDDGISMRTLPWTQYKMNIDRWFYWYANVNTPSNWFQTATTWGSVSYFDGSLGLYGNDGTSNGNGLLVYPGTDVNHTSDSYGVNGPIASLRLKEWRRGIQDTDYLALANRINPGATKAIVNQAIPKALWENPAPNNDPSYFVGPVSWSSNPDDWETKRAQLSQMISNYCTANPSSGVCVGN
ncbi:MAG: glycoside hydrolase domain-containing protein [Bryobacteraceae bacterium]